MRRLLLDTNVLLLWTIGTHDRRLVGRHRRVSTFVEADLDLLHGEARRCGSLVTTGPLLTETSNLLGNDFHRAIAKTLIQLSDAMIESSSPKERIVAHPGFAVLGYADVSALLALDDQTSLLTDDALLPLRASVTRRPRGFEFQSPPQTVE